MKRQLLTASVLVAMAASMAQAQGADGKTVYDANCKKCHGATGAPAPVMKKKFDKLAAFNAAFFKTRTEEDVVKAIAKGKGDDMKPYGEKLSADEIKAVSKYIRTLGQ